MFLNSLNKGLLVVMVILITGCAYNPSEYSYYNVQQEQTVRYGFIDSVRIVNVGGPNTGLGAASGAIIGGIAGSHIGGGSGQVVGAIGGALVGGIIGNNIEASNNNYQTEEYTIHLENGRTIVIVQPYGQNLRPGDRVKIISDGYNNSRVTRY